VKGYKGIFAFPMYGLTNASASADSASRLCWRIFCAMTGRWGGRSMGALWTDLPLLQNTFHN